LQEFSGSAILEAFEMHENNNLSDQFMEDIRRGMTSSPKHLSSKYFYDIQGDKIFQQIMDMPEYYLTDCELEIFQGSKDGLLSHFQNNSSLFHLIEFGAGDGMKTKILLDHFTGSKANFIYNPIDISQHVLSGLQEELLEEYPDMKVEPLNKEYFDALDDIGRQCCGKKVILFLGSNIGNFREKEALEFFRGIFERLNPGDLLLTGFDLKKDPDIILRAYNDPAGITGEFNKNLLTRINRELDADFDLSRFFHYPVYDPESGETRSYLVSNENHKVRLNRLSLTVYFDKWEAIFMEVSQKYDVQQIEALAVNTGFTLVNNFYDSQRFFVGSLWKVN